MEPVECDECGRVIDAADPEFGTWQGWRPLGGGPLMWWCPECLEAHAG